MKDGVVNAIAVDELANRFGEVHAVADASLEVLHGGLFGFRFD